MLYKFRVTSPNGAIEIVEGDWPNQSSARTAAIRSRLFVQMGEVQESECDAELLEPFALTAAGATVTAHGQRKQ